MYHHPGEYVTDFCIIHSRQDGLYHLFHIRGERWTWPLGYKEIDLGHAVSTDLRLWTPQPPVLPAGPAGAWDEAGNWAPDIIEVDGVYYLYYTGSDALNNQKIGLAVSTDLYTWTKHPNNPVVEPGPWSDRAVGRNVTGRDAMVYADKERNRYLMYYTATMADGRACIALAQSQDLIQWQDLGPTYIEEDRSYNRCESAYLVAHGDRYYLFYSAKGGPNSKGFSPQAFAHFEIVYLVSSQPTGGWLKPHNHKLLEEWTCASEHPTFGGATYMFYVIQEEINGVWGASSLSDPKQIVWLPDGTVQIREHTPDNVERRSLFSSETDSYNGWVSRGEGQWSSAPGLLSVVTGGVDAYFTHTLWGADLAMEAEMQAEEGSVASLIVRGNPSAMAGYRVSLDFERGIVGLYLRFPGRPDQTIQERAVELKAGQRYNLKVVVQGNFFEIYVDGVLLITRQDSVYESGCFGLHARGTVQFWRVQAYRYIGPEGVAPDWYSHCRPRHLFSVVTKELATNNEIIRPARGKLAGSNEIQMLRDELAVKEKVIQTQYSQLVAKEDVIQKLEAFRLDSLRYRQMAGLFHSSLMWLGQWVWHHFSPRLGMLRHYPPIPWQIPEWYTAIAAPANPPLISIVTPTFNHVHFLERTINSVLGQNYSNLEYIIQDGGSTDGTAAILEKYRASLKHAESRPDQGQAHALNLGFTHATGEIMAYLNSDDLLLPGALSCVAAFFAKHPEVDVIYGHRLLINEYDKEIGRWVLPPHNPKILLWADYVPQETLFWRRRIWEKTGGYIDESYCFAMDWELLLRFQEAGAKFARLPRFLGAFRVHIAQKSSNQIDEVGQQEMSRLRERCHGRPVSQREIGQAIGLYLIRSVIYHKLYRLGLLRY